MENKMFCFQCQETAGCTGCTKFGVCGKSPDLARMQDLLIYTTKGLSEEKHSIIFKLSSVISSRAFKLISLGFIINLTPPFLPLEE